MIRIRFEPSGLEVSASTNGPLRLVDVIDELPTTAVQLACRSAHCGACRVQVEAGAMCLESAQRDEIETLLSFSATPVERLACQLTLRSHAEGTVVLRVPESFVG